MMTQDVGVVWNIPGTSVLKKYRQKSYKKQIGTTCTTCSNRDCKYANPSPVIVGAHMTDGTYAYLIPICSGCNHPSNTDQMVLRPGRKIKYIGTLTSIEQQILDREVDNIIRAAKKMHISA